MLSPVHNHLFLPYITISFNMTRSPYIYRYLISSLLNDVLDIPNSGKTSATRFFRISGSVVQQKQFNRLVGRHIAIALMTAKATAATAEKAHIAEDADKPGAYLYKMKSQLCPLDSEFPDKVYTPQKVPTTVKNNAALNLLIKEGK